MLHWQCLLPLNDSDLARLEIAEMNLACAIDVPGKIKIDWQLNRSRLDQWAKSCALFVGRAIRQYRPGQGDTEAQFRILAMISHLQRDLGVRYHPEKIAEDAKFHVEDTFIHGITQGQGGTCASLPVLYATIGRRLGYPIKLVSTLRHLYCRWDGQGERFNIEASGEGTNFFDDEHFRTGRYAISESKMKANKYNQSQSPRGEFAGFMSSRGFAFLDLGLYRQAVESFAWANEIEPDRRSHPYCTDLAMCEWDRVLKTKLPPWGFPKLDLGIPAPRFRNMPRTVEKKLIGMTVTEDVLNDKEMNDKWWQPLRRNPGVTPKGLPEWLRIDYRWPRLLPALRWNN